MFGEYIGSALSISGGLAGWQSLAATIAGGLLIFAGLSRLLLMLPVFQHAERVQAPSRIAGLLHHAKPVIASQGPLARGYLTGLLTTWLPCGWLYLFVLVLGTGYGSFVAVSSAKVARRSVKQMACSVTDPGFTFPGQRTINGVRRLS